MKHHEAWFAIFQAAIMGVTAKTDANANSIAKFARTVADEGMQQLHPGIVDVETNQGLLPLYAVGAGSVPGSTVPQPGSTVPQPDSSALTSAGDGQSEDDVEQARR
jgi:hypothetical protein